MRAWFRADPIRQVWAMLLCGLLLAPVVAGMLTSWRDQVAERAWQDKPLPTVGELQAFKAEHGQHWQDEVP